MFWKTAQRANHLALAAALAAAVLAGVAPSDGVHAATLLTLHPFCARTACADGSTPIGPLVRDGAGNLYGTASVGGTNNLGTVFELANTGTGYQFEVLHNFCNTSGCPDGQNPLAGLIIDTNGHLYGVTQRGGTQNEGTLYELIPGTPWRFKVRANFCPFCSAGFQPIYKLTYQGELSGAPYDGTSPVYGVTLGGLGNGSKGVAFQATPVSGQQLWNVTNLYTFCSKANCTDGNVPSAPLVVDAGGNLFGVTKGGGLNNDGVAFEIPAGGGSEIVLHNFCHLANCADGSVPAGLTMDGSENLLGTTQEGGANGFGAIFKIVPTATGFRETVVYSFCVSSGCPDGQDPRAGLTPDGTGTFFGATWAGGDHQGGVLFKLRGGTYTAIASFCTPTACLHGAAPEAPVILDPSGNLYGTTTEGGADSGGTVFELRRTAPP